VEVAEAAAAAGAVAADGGDERREPFSFVPIGLVRTPFKDRLSAPRQPAAAEGVPGTLELFGGSGYEHALEDLEGFDHLVVLFVFHRNEEEGRGWRPKVLPPRSTKRRGVFATRSPHRPNPIGMSVVELVRVEGLVVHVRNVDMLDESPLLDIKPYVPYADAYPEAKSGWLELDPAPAYEIVWREPARAQAAWLRERGVDLEAKVSEILALGPQPHPYRRIRREGDAMRLAVRDWRVRFRVEGRRVLVESVASGYRPRDLATGTDGTLEAHRAFVALFGASGLAGAAK
jgi:tRNA (adenine37-N6)-methyltransferase